MMKMVKWTLTAAGLVTIAYAAALVCWRLWMYNGIPAPPRYLHRFIWFDGEKSYALTEVEIFGVCLMAICVILRNVGGWKRRGQNNTLIRTVDSRAGTAANLRLG